MLGRETRRLLVAAAMAIALGVPAAVAFDPADVENVQKWHSCRKCDLTDAVLRGANLTDARLSRADLTGADLSAANLSRANLTGADLSDASLCATTMPDGHVDYSDCP